MIEQQPTPQYSEKEQRLFALIDKLRAAQQSQAPQPEPVDHEILA